jgi:TonB family protein
VTDDGVSADIGCTTVRRRRRRVARVSRAGRDGAGADLDVVRPAAAADRRHHAAGRRRWRCRRARGCRGRATVVCGGVRARRAAPPPRPRAPSAPREPASTVDGPAASVAAGAPASGGGAAGEAGGAAGGAGNAGDGAGGADGLRAFCRSCPAPTYPSRARRQGWQGTVEVGLRVAADGSVASASVERSSGYPTLDDVALASARASRFAVPTGGGGLDGRLRYRFLLDETAAER